MNAEIMTDPNLVQKVKRTKKNKHKNRKTLSKKFDKESFFLAWGLALVFAVIGIYIIWAIQSTQEGTSGSSGFNTSRHLIGFFPESVKETLVFILGNIFIFGAVLCIFLGLKIVVRYIVGKSWKYKKSLKLNFFKTGFKKLLSDKTSFSK